MRASKLCAAKRVNDIMGEWFDKDYLALHSLTGVAGNGNTPAKDPLPKAVVDSIIGKYNSPMLCKMTC